jgi:predicted Zn finger-like uncharacterized protein
MKIECPSCRLTGDINEIELPPEGGLINCPRCKNRFHVAKPAPPAKKGHMMNTCPVCQYSTFTDEMFSTCPKCGATGTNYQEMLKKKAEREQIRRDQDVLNRSLRNPDLFVPPPPEEAPTPSKPRTPDPVRIAGGISAAVGAVFLIYGFTGLANYYSKDWQAILSEPLLEPISKTSLFFRLGFLPWLRTLFGVSFVAMSILFLMLHKQAQKWLTKCAWAGVALAVINETAEFMNWIRVSSDSPSFSYIVVGAVNSLFMIIPWSAPFLALTWYLQRDNILREFPECSPDPLLSRLLEKLPFNI